MRIFSLIALLCLFFGASARGQEGKPAIAWKQTEYRFGKVGAGLKHGHSFRFRNTGTAPLVIQRAKASCGCLYVQYDPKPVLPGDSGEVRITYNSIGFPMGAFYKSVPVVTNAGETELILRGELVTNRPRLEPKGGDLH